ncbi:MAG: hypothetical protein R2873_21510 [Caldilineaceae bacterium]
MNTSLCVRSLCVRSLCVRIVLIVVLLMNIAPASQAFAQSGATLAEPVTWQIVDSTPDHLRVDIHIHDDDPALNGHGVLLGVPSLDDLSLHVLDLETITLPQSSQPTLPPPAPVDSLFDAPELNGPTAPPRPDAAAPVEIAESGRLRDQAYVLLRVYPRQYDATHDVDRFYTFLQVEIRWQVQGIQQKFSACRRGAV